MRCSVVAMTNYHRLSDLKQHEFIILYFWKPEAHPDLTELKLRSGNSRRESVCLPFLACREPIFLLLPCVFKSRKVWWSLSHIASHTDSSDSIFPI